MGEEAEDTQYAPSADIWMYVSVNPPSRSVFVIVIQHMMFLKQYTHQLNLVVIVSHPSLVMSMGKLILDRLLIYSVST